MKTAQEFRAGQVANINGSPWVFCPGSGGTLYGGNSCVLSVAYAASGDTSDIDFWNSVLSRRRPFAPQKAAAGKR